MHLDWNHFYILGWYDSNRKPYLTTWDGKAPIITAVITGPKVQTHGPPIWDSPEVWKGYGLAYEKYTIHELPCEVGAEIIEDPYHAAELLGGVVAFGWYIQKGFTRKWHDPNEKIHEVK